MAHALWEIWEDTDRGRDGYLWRAHLINYVGRFESREKAEAYVSSVREYRKKHKIM